VDLQVGKSAHIKFKGWPSGISLLMLVIDRRKQIGFPVHALKKNGY
jgi:hypothetical protein